MNANPHAPKAAEIRTLQGDITALMLRYNDAFDACGQIPQLDILRFLRPFWQLFLWAFSFDFAMLTMLVDVPLWVCKKLFGWPDFRLGRVFYRVLLWPVRAAQAGEVPAMHVIRIRYLSRLLLFYHAQARMDALRRAFNGMHLRLLAESTVGQDVFEEAETLQDAFDLFEKLTADRYQIGALVVFGPLITALSIVTQKFILPALDELWVRFWGLFHDDITRTLFNATLLQSALGAVAVLIFYVVFLAVSVWMDQRDILRQVDIAPIEQQAFAAAGIPLLPKWPIDLIALFVLGAAGAAAAYWVETHPDTLLGQSFTSTDPDTPLGYIALGIACVVLSLIALDRRLDRPNWLVPRWLRNSSIKRDVLPLS